MCALSLFFLTEYSSDMRQRLGLFLKIQRNGNQVCHDVKESKEKGDREGQTSEIEEEYRGARGWVKIEGETERRA